MTEDSSKSLQMQGPLCPIPLTHTEKIVMGHGSGGQMTQSLIESVFKSRIGNAFLQQGNDAANIKLQKSGTCLAVSTDSHVVSPLFFPGGDIGRLAICGTVNDVAMLGAEPAYLTAGFILEEGLAVKTLIRVIESMAAACEEAGVQIVAGDTKVVEKGKADGLYINTAGFGQITSEHPIGGQYAQPGDAVLVSGPMGDHGIAVLQARGDLGFDSNIQSDVAPLNGMIADLVNELPEIHVLRDPTRGGLATTLNEIACQSEVGLALEESTIPVKPAVRTACEMLGFDPLYIANEGKLILILPKANAEKALSILQSHDYGKEAAVIGSVKAENPGRVLLKTSLGTTRMLDTLSGEILPRIC